MDAQQQLIDWIRQGESEIQEFKKSTGQSSDAAKTICAMLNTRGGRVIIGVDPKDALLPERRLRGQQLSDKSIEDLFNYIRRIDPPAFPRIDRQLVNPDKHLEAVVVTVPSGYQKPYKINGVAYKRVGNSTVEISQHEAERLLLERLHSTERWENQAAPNFSVDDIDEKELTLMVEEAIRRGRSEEPGTRNPLELLRGLGLLTRDGELTNASLALFGRGGHVESAFPQLRLRVARFRGNTKDEFLDNRQFFGNAFSLLRRAENFLIESLPKAGRIVPGVFERIDDPIYPPEALREALANALCHRDYAITGGSVGIAIFDDRLEITSSGELHFGLTIEDLYKPHESHPWNPTMASVFFKRGIVETWGRGTLKIIDKVQRAGLVSPEFDVIAGAVVVRFSPQGYVAPTRVHHNLSEAQQGILKVLADSGEMSLSEIAAALHLGDNVRPLKSDLAHLKNLELVKLRGKGRGAKWSVQ